MSVAVLRKVRSLFPARVRTGPGTGLRMDLRWASAWYARGDVEPEAQRRIVETLGPGDVFYDVGANVGFFSLLAARRVGEAGEVWAFEPAPKQARAIRRNARRNRLDNIHVIEAAVAAAPGEGTLALAEHPGGAALLGAAAPPPDAAGTRPVRVVSVDSVVDEGAPPPRLVKIDVEGAELAVVEGMTRTIETHRPWILCELDAPGDEELEAKRAAVAAALAQRGMAVETLTSGYAGSWRVAHLWAAPEREA